MKCRPWRHQWAPWTFHWMFFEKWRERRCVKCDKVKVGYWAG